MVEEGKTTKNRLHKRGLLRAPTMESVRVSAQSATSTQDAMDELLDETFNSESLDDMHSLVGLEEPPETDETEAPVLAGPTSPEARAKRYQKLRTEDSFWDELERQEE